MSTRFGGIERLYGREHFVRIQGATVCIVGIGGVGVWVAEALARSGVGRLHLVDLDDLCVSNVNRQLHALEPTIGRPKVEVMAERVRSINPQCDVIADARFFTESTAESLLSARPDCIVDAIDNVRNKCLLIAECCRRGLRVVASGGAGGRRDPTQILTEDLARTRNDPLMAQVRKQLRQEHGFPRDPLVRFGVPSVFSIEPVITPEDACDATEGRAMNCNTGLGTCAMVTGTFGLYLATLVVKELGSY